MRMKKSIYSLFILTLFFLFSCIRAIDYYNARGAETDMSNFMKQAGLPTKNLECRMLDGSRIFTCLIDINEEEVQKLIRNFKLLPGKADMVKPYPPKESSPVGCEELPDFSPDLIEEYRTEKYRPKETGGFDFFRILFNKTEKKGCIHSAYGYG